MQRIFLGLLVVVLVSPAGAHNPRPALSPDPGQATGCTERKWPALSAHDPAYADAMDLAQSLTNQRFVVVCVAPSKWGGTFEGQEDAALFATTEGSFDVLFLPSLQNFDELQVIERQESGRYVYSFGGHPRARHIHTVDGLATVDLLLDGIRPIYFIPHMNQLIVAFDGQLAARLKGALGER